MSTLLDSEEWSCLLEMIQQYTILRDQQAARIEIIVNRLTILEQNIYLVKWPQVDSEGKDIDPKEYKADITAKLNTVITNFRNVCARLDEFHAVYQHDDDVRELIETARANEQRALILIDHVSSSVEAFLKKTEEKPLSDDEKENFNKDAKDAGAGGNRDG